MGQLLLTVLAFLLLRAGESQRAQEGAELQVGGQVAERQSELASSVVLDHMAPQSTSGAPTRGRFSAHRPYAGVTDSEYKSRKDLAATRVVGSQGATQAPVLTLAPGGAVLTPTPVGSFVGQDETCAAVTPSDMALAVSPQFVLQVVNDCLSVYDKSGNVKPGYPKSVTTFFGLPPNNLTTGQFASDPRAFFDWVKNRFVFVILYEDFPNSRGFLELAASATSDPTGAWHVYQIQVGSSGTCPDFPTLGQNWASDSFDGDIAVGFNIFPCNAAGFFNKLVDDQVWFLPKSLVYSGSSFGFNIFLHPTYNGALLDSIQPVNVSARGDKPRAQFAVNSFNMNFGGGQCSITGCNGLVIWAFSNVLQKSGSPGLQWSSVVVRTPSDYGLPANASQPGGLGTIDTGDTRISGQIQYSAGSMYATLNTNNGGGSGILAWQFHATLNDNGAAGPGVCTGSFLNACPAITSAVIDQEIGYDATSGGAVSSAYYGTIQPDPERNITMVFNFSGTNAFPSTAYTANRVTQRPGSWHDNGVFLAPTGSAFYGDGRWGDYTGTAPDLNVNTPAMWFSGMYVRSDGSWGTTIGKNSYASANQP